MDSIYPMRGEATLCRQCGWRNPVGGEFCEKCGSFLEFYGMSSDEHERQQAMIQEQKAAEQAKAAEPAGPGDYVELVKDNTMMLRCERPEFQGWLKTLGASHPLGKKSTWRLRYSSYEELAWHFGNLRDAGFAFQAGKGWSPSALFWHLRDELGILQGTYTEIDWKDGESFVKTTK